MKVYIDINIIMDWATKREPFAKNANLIMSLARQGVFDAYTSPLAMATLFYLLRKEQGKILTLEFMQDCQKFIQFLPNSTNALTQAINNPYKDFEDDLHFYSAIDSKMDMIVTRNTKDFLNNYLIKIVTPDELLYELGY